MYDDCPYNIDGLLGSDCLPTSFVKLNENFDNLQAAVCDLTNTVNRKLSAANQNNILLGNTLVLNFSGGAVTAYNDPPYQTARKTVFVPLTGVLSVETLPTVFDTSLIHPLLEVYNYTGPRLGEGHIQLRVRAPQLPRQVRTFFYHGPTNATPQDQMDDGKTTRPSNKTIENFVNSLNLNQQTVSRLGDEVWVIYQKSGYSTFDTGASQFPVHTHDHSGSVTVPGHSHNFTGKTSSSVDNHSHSVKVKTSSLGNHSHSVYLICHGRGPATSSSNGDHSHSYGAVYANGGHSHTIGATSFLPSVAYGVAATTAASKYNTIPNNDGTFPSSYVIPNVTINRFMPCTVIWKLTYQASNTYAVATNYPKYVQAQGASADSWTTPNKWTKYL